MDTNPQDAQQPISDDQELAKALAGVTADVDTPADSSTPTAPQTDNTTPSTDSSAPATPPAPVTPPAPATPNLEDIKKTALGELRPLIDRVDLPVEDKFDTYLMLIRSTDDSSLIGPAHAAAQAISDEKRRAEALLDIVKEIDYLSRPQQ